MTVRQSNWHAGFCAAMIAVAQGTTAFAYSHKIPDDVPWPSMPGPESEYITHHPISNHGRWIVAGNIHLLSCDDENVFVQECDAQMTLKDIEEFVKNNPLMPATLNHTSSCVIARRTQSFPKHKFKSMLYRHVRNETLSAAAQLGPRDFERIQAAPVDPVPYQKTRTELKSQILAKEKLIAQSQILSEAQKAAESEKLAELRAQLRKNDVVMNEIRKGAEARKKLEQIVEGWVDYGICGEGMKKATGTTAKIINVVKSPRSMELCGESGEIRSRLQDCLKYTRTKVPTVARMFRPDGTVVDILKTATDGDYSFGESPMPMLSEAKFLGPLDTNAGMGYTRKEAKAFCESLNRKDQYGLPNPAFSGTNYRRYFWTIKPFPVEKGRIHWHLPDKDGSFYVLFSDANEEAARGSIRCTGVFRSFQ